MLENITPPDVVDVFVQVAALQDSVGGEAFAEDEVIHIAFPKLPQPPDLSVQAGPSE